MKKKMFSITGIAALVILIACFSCGKSSDNNTNTTPQVATININSMSFSPASKTVAKDSTVKWHNADGATHTATSNDGTTFNSGGLPANSDYTYTANTAGTFEYHCTIHGLAMAGTLIVTP